MIGRVVVWAALLLGVFSASGWGVETSLEYFTTITDIASSCFPQAIRLSATPLEAVDWPQSLGASLYGELPLGEGNHAIMVDRVAERTDLYVDVDRTGSFQGFEWDRSLEDGSLLASVPFSIQISQEQVETYQAFIIWNPMNAAIVTYCRDSYRAGAIQLGESLVDLVVVDENTDGLYDDLSNGALFIDIDGDGTLLLTSDSHEIYRLSEPFNIAGTTYEVAALAPDGSQIEIVESAFSVPPKPILLAGNPAPSFVGVDAQGSPFSLEALRGSIVVLDFWAGWCGPCIFEIPTLKALASEFADRDVRVVGINLDRSEQEFREAVETYEIDSQQIYDSNRGPIGDLYRIQGIPMIYIIDREGLIHARGLRGEGLILAVRDLIESED